jgi:demethylspheroidene O-methyltransferase
MRALFDLCSGFVYSQVLLACTRLNLFERLSASPRSASELAEELDLPIASMHRLLDAADSLGLVERRRHQRFGLGPLGAALLGNPAVAMMIEHHRAFYRDMADPVALLRNEHATTELSRFWAYADNDRAADLQKADTDAYSDLMAQSQTLIADQVLGAYSLGRHRILLDVGGGSGAFVEAAMARHPSLQACVFDLPSVVERARERFELAGSSDRAGVCGGSFLSDPLPEGADVISLVRVLHDHDDDQVLRILKAARSALDPDGVLLIAEPMLATRGAEPVGAAYFGFYLLAMGQGRPRSRDELHALLNEAGFSVVKSHRTTAPLLVRVLTARFR